LLLFEDIMINWVSIYRNISENNNSTFCFFSESSYDKNGHCIYHNDPYGPTLLSYMTRFWNYLQLLPSENCSPYARNIRLWETGKGCL